ncbi:OLC1v1009412C1 [Oldenlandia corymbosa var. corymbosa]|uniref:OLC1v1009412C1 n=1 Tax=Oldenlandia corymbosa var. corymbosa TaxID=529605 RepID=A0AAV1DNU7_OLDCO|nr:OLC1v1009412C1 [Oldenlandia corymbosa var. corymbosa]
MPKNKGKGGKNRKRGKNEAEDDVKRELVYKSDGQKYGQVHGMLGEGRWHDDKVDIIYKYTTDESRSLKADKQLPENFRINVVTIVGDDDDDTDPDVHYVDYADE